MDLGGGEKKRPRTSSGGTTLSSQHVTENLHRYGEILLHCNVNITYGIRECGNSIVLKYVCALLNSGGGILHMHNLDAERGVVMSKHLDTWWSGMEIKMAEILSKDDICNYFDLVGNHDDRDLYLFVKTAEHLCTLTYHCRLPTDTATHYVTYQSLLRLLVTHGDPGTLDELPPIPVRYIFGHSAGDLKKETKQIQFKQLATQQSKKGKSTLPDRVVSLMIKYVSAFANHEGGHIYFGIGDTRASVIGEEMNHEEQKHLEMLIAQRMRNVIWQDSSVAVIRGIHWDIKFLPVENTPKHSSRVVVVVSVVKFPGAVFTNCPVSSYVNHEGRVEDFTFDQWRECILNPLRDVPELHHRFIKLSLMVPRSPLVFTLPNTIETIIKKELLGKSESDLIQPRQYIESYAPLKYRETIKNVLVSLKGNNCLCLGMECWGLKIPMMDCDDIICDIAVVTETDNVHVVTLATARSTEAVHHSQAAATMLKNKLVQSGGCTEKFSVCAQVLDITHPNVLDILDQQLHQDIYPSHFSASNRKFGKLLHAIAVCMGAYMAKSQVVNSMNQNGHYYFLLTHDQFELLWTQQFTRELWVHGPAGSGKTVAAVQMIQELRRRGCAADNILYLAENEKLCEFVRSHNLCLVITRRELLTDFSDHSQVVGDKYSSICNVIVDEAQNFKDWDGDWYSLAEKLSNQKAGEHLHRCCNYFWLFMDYSQKVHKFKAGLPSVIGKNNFMLSEVSRSTKEIFDFTSRLMMASENVDHLVSPAVFRPAQTHPKLAHNFSSGKGVDILSCKETEVKALLSKVLSGLLSNGIEEDDITILVGKRNQVKPLQSTLSDICIDETKGSSGNQVKQFKEREMVSRRSVEEHLRKCGSDGNNIQALKKKRVTSKPTVNSDQPTKPGAINTVDQTDPRYSDKPTSPSYLEDLSDVSSDDDSIEISNPFDVLDSGENTAKDLNATENCAGVLESDRDNEAGVAEESRDKHSPDAKREKVKFYRIDSVIEDDDTEMMKTGNQEQLGVNNNMMDDTDEKDMQEVVAMEPSIAIDTVRQFSGLDKAAIIGLNPCVNEETADFKRFMLSLATRAKDNLVIITTSDDVKKKLDELMV